MSLVSKIKEARDAFHDACESKISDGKDSFPEVLMDYMPMLGVALIRTEKLGEPYYHGLTNRSAFYGTHNAAQQVFNKYVGTVSKVYDNEGLMVKDKLTLSDGVSKTQLEDCYKILDAAVRQLEN